jgi:hypothetical protein
VGTRASYNEAELVASRMCLLTLMGARLATLCSAIAKCVKVFREGTANRSVVFLCLLRSLPRFWASLIVWALCRPRQRPAGVQRLLKPAVPPAPPGLLDPHDSRRWSLTAPMTALSFSGGPLVLFIGLSCDCSLHWSLLRLFSSLVSLAMYTCRARSAANPLWRIDSFLYSSLAQSPVSAG